MENENSQEKEKSWYSDFSLKATMLYLAISIIGGGATGAGVAIKGVSAAPQISGITQDQADVRYLSRTEAEARITERNRQLEEIKRNVLTREVFEAYHKADADRMERLEKLVERILENQNGK